MVIYNYLLIRITFANKLPIILYLISRMLFIINYKSKDSIPYCHIKYSFFESRPNILYTMHTLFSLIFYLFCMTSVSPAPTKHIDFIVSDIGSNI